MKILNEQPTTDAPGEKIVLDLLRRIDGDWIAIHQVPLRKKTKWEPERKPDFVLVIPYHGVLILEIKSSPNVQYRDGGFKVGTEAKDPLQQVEDSFFNLKQWHDRQYANTPFRRLTMACTLGFTAASPDTSRGPNILKSPNPQNHHGYQVAYADTFTSEDRLKSMLIKALAGAKAAWGSSADSFGPSEAEQWAQARMPSAPVNTSQSAVTSYFVRSREEFTEQQQLVYYKLLRVVPKVFIAGAWGTGKTFLAKHLAVRSAIEGRHVCIVVKRKELMGQLALDVREEIKNRGLLAGSLDVRTVDSILYGLAQNSHNKKYDELVLDQAEDFLDLKTLESLGDALVGGWSAESRIKIFADFENQGYQSPASVKEVLDWLERTGFVGVREDPLSHNLRNGKSIAREVEKIGRKRVYSDYLPEEGQVRSHIVDLGDVFGIMSENLRETPLRTWNVSQALINVLKELKREGYAPGDVVVLTALPRTTSTAGEPSASQSSPAFVATGWDYKMPSEGEVRNGHDGSPERPYVGNDFRWPHDRTGLTDDWIPVDRIDVQWQGEMDENDQMIGPDLRRRVTWCTVEEFAGCESTVIVLTDVHMAKKSVRERRLTRGLSRASQRAVLIVVNVPKPESDY